MDIHIEAPKHPNFLPLEKHYKEKLTERYSVYEFIKRIEVRVTSEHNETTVKFVVDLEREPKSVVSDTDPSEDKALKSTMDKLDKIIRKYKTKHYH